MKKIIFPVLGIFLIFSAANCLAQKKSKPPVLKNNQDTISYLIGADIGANIRKNYIILTLDVFWQGFLAGYNDADSLIPLATKQKVMEKFQKDLQAQQQAKMADKALKSKAEGKSFLEANKKKEGVIETSSGLQYKIIKEGTGPKPKLEDKVKCHYEGHYIDGNTFDSSYDRGEPAVFPLNGVIKGWTEALQLMPTGSIYELYIPADLGYGDNDYMDIPGGSTLIFKVELISIEIN